MDSSWNQELGCAWDELCHYTWRRLQFGFGWLVLSIRGEVRVMLGMRHESICLRVRAGSPVVQETMMSVWQKQFGGRQSREGLLGSRFCCYVVSRLRCGSFHGHHQG